MNATKNAKEESGVKTPPFEMDHEVISNHRCCAERTLFGELMRDASRHGIPPYKRVAWLYRKYGGHLVVWRQLANGTLGCSAPCVLCKREIIRMHWSVHAVDSKIQWFHGRMTDDNAPVAKPTSGQVKYLKFKRGG